MSIANTGRASIPDPQKTVDDRHLHLKEQVTGPAARERRRGNVSASALPTPAPSRMYTVVTPGDDTP